MIRRTLATAVLILGASVIAAFFESADATAVIRALAFLPLLQGLRNIGVVEFQQDLQFGQERFLVPTTPPRFGDVVPTDFGPPAVGRVL